MESFKPIKGYSYLELIGIMFLVDILLLIVSYFASTYELIVVLRLVFIIFNVYQLNYIFLYHTLTFKVDEQYLYINGNWGLKKVILPFKEIQQYYISKGNIKGIRLSGYGSNHFALGRSVLDKIGTTYMFVTSNKNIVYLKTSLGNFALSPEDLEGFREKLTESNVHMAEWEQNFSKYSGINKEKKFITLLVIASGLVLFMIINPCIWYLNGNIPLKAPLTFDGNFMPVKWGTSKEFLFKQMSYGVLNMGVLFCMYYAAYFCAKYDKKTAYRFIYAVIVLALAFLFMQYRILFYFK